MIAVIPVKGVSIAERKSVRRRRRSVSRSLKQRASMSILSISRTIRVREVEAVENGPVNAGECPTYLGVF
jgi:hypothetical protein